MGKTSRDSVMLKKENKMSFLEDVFQTADEIKQSQEKFKSATEASFHQLDVLVRPYLGEVQNETLSDIRVRCRAFVPNRLQQRHADVCRSGGSTRGKGLCATVKQKPPYLLAQAKR